MQSVLGFTIENKIVRWHFITANVSGFCVVALRRNLKLTTTLDRAITQNPCYVPLNLELCTTFQ